MSQLPSATTEEFPTTQKDRKIRGDPSDRYVVVLGEAGTGKTTEFALQAARLTAAGTFAVVVELGTLASQGLGACLGPREARMLEVWRPSDAEGTFFLDALDEAKLRSWTFRQALRRLSQELSGEWHRVRLVASCRVSDWMAIADREELQSLASDCQVQVVELTPLNVTQVERLVAFAGVHDPGAFTAAVADHFAQAFIERPLDVEWLGAYWIRHRKLASLRELVSDNVREKLRERNGRSTTLTSAKAEIGLLALAGMATLTRRWSFLLPDEGLDAVQRAGALDPLDILPNWTPDEVRQLLSRPIFDESTYGRVRIHHRTVQEYLAARWLAELMSRGLPRASVEGLILRGRGNDRVVPAHLGPVAAWLSLSDRSLREQLMLVAPTLLIAHGDPAGLSEDDRGRTLSAFASLYQSRDRIFARFDQASLRRFGAAALAGRVKTLLSDADTPVELTHFLLDLVTHARIVACASDCLAIAADPSRPSELRAAAVRAAASAGDAASFDSLLRLLGGERSWEHELSGALIRALYPDRLSPRGVIDVLRDTVPAPRNHITGFQVVLEHDLVRGGSPPIRAGLLKELVKLIWVIDEKSGRHRVADRYEWLVGCLARLLSAVVDDNRGAVACSDEVAEAFRALGWCNAHGLRAGYGLDEPVKTLQADASLRRALFWRRLREYKLDGGRNWTRYQSVKHPHDLLVVSDADREWLAFDAVGPLPLAERLLALDTLASLGMDSDEQKAELARVARSSPELGRRLDRMLRHAEMHADFSSRFARTRAARELARAKARSADTAEIASRLQQVREGRDIEVLWYLLERARPGISSYGEVDGEALRNEFGAEIRDAAVAGWRAFWKRCCPILPHEREDRSSTPGAIVLAIVGLGFDFAAGLCADRLQPREVEAAVRCAAYELNRFPGWLDDIALAHPVSTAAILGPALAADFLQTADIHHGNEVLGKLPRASEHTRLLLLPLIRELLCRREPRTVRALSDALDVAALLHPWNGATLEAVARARCTASCLEPVRFAHWWWAWWQNSPSASLHFLECTVIHLAPDAADSLVLGVCDRIHDASEGHAPVPFSLHEDASSLFRLIPIVYAHIRRSEDVDHHCVYTPGPRDNAQRLRGQLLAWLANAVDGASVDKLGALAVDARLTEVKDWILHLRDERASRDAQRADHPLVALLSDVYGGWGTDAVEHVAAKKEEGTVIRILFVGSNPETTARLALGEEIRNIEDALRGSKCSERVSIESHWAARPGDLQRVLMEKSPTIVHFSGHGVGRSGLVFHSDNGGEALVSAKALRSLFRVLKDGIRIVVLNACYSSEQAAAISEEVDFVVGMSDSIGDEAAAVFSAAFYRGLAFDRSVQASFDLGINDLQLGNFTRDEVVPELLVNRHASAADTFLLRLICVIEMREVAASMLAKIGAR